MGSIRKKKEKKKDFQKPKLKVGKTALNAANHTSTDFKAKRINISSSTRNLINNKHDGSSEYMKKLSVVRKTTANLSSRKEILAELLDIVKKDPYNETHQLPLDEIIKVLRMLFLDQSKKIRTDSRAILCELIKHHNNLVVLNHDSIMLFIFSAMTHLKPTIRQDSIYTLRAIIDGGDRLKELTISNHWVRVWKNVLVLMNWKKENKSYVDANDFKDFEGMRLEQLNFLNEFLQCGCFEAATASEEAEMREGNAIVVQQHDLLSTYMIKPNMGMLYRNLKLFGNVNIVSTNANTGMDSDKKLDEDASTEIDDAMLCEDINDRVKIFIEGFYESVKNGLTDFSKVEDNKLVTVSTKLLKTVDEIKAKYEGIAE